MTKIFFMQTATFHGFIRWEKTGFIVAFAEKVVKISFKTVRRVKSSAESMERIAERDGNIVLSVIV